MRFPLTMFVLSLVTVSLTTCLPARNAEPASVHLSAEAVRLITTTTPPTTSTLPSPDVYRPVMEQGVTTTSTTLPAGNWRCPEWVSLALEVGFPADELDTVDFLIARESTCHPDSFNRTDPNGGSRGLLQINGIWCQHWLQDQGIVHTCDDLFDPIMNLRAGLAIRWRQHGYGAWGL